MEWLLLVYTSACILTLMNFLGSNFFLRASVIASDRTKFLLTSIFNVVLLSILISLNDLSLANRGHSEFSFLWSYTM